MMGRAIIAFAVVILVIAEIRAQDGDDNRCGRNPACQEDECCAGRGWFAMCRKLPGENQLCGGRFSCANCAAGLECKVVYPGVFVKVSMCKPMSTTSTSTESFSTVTSTSTTSAWTDDSTADTTIVAGGD